MKRLVLFVVIIMSIQNVFAGTENVTTEQIAIDSINGGKTFVPQYSLDSRMALAYLGDSTCHVFNNDKSIKTSFKLNFEKDGNTIKLDNSKTCQVEGSNIVCELNDSDLLAIDIGQAVGVSSSPTSKDFFAVDGVGLLAIGKDMFTADCVTLTNLK